MKLQKAGRGDQRCILAQEGHLQYQVPVSRGLSANSGALAGLPIHKMRA